jgi:hypothetical protein
MRIGSDVIGDKSDAGSLIPRNVTHSRHAESGGPSTLHSVGLSSLYRIVGITGSDDHSRSNNLDALHRQSCEPVAVSRGASKGMRWLCGVIERVWWMCGGGVGGGGGGEDPMVV